MPVVICDEDSQEKALNLFNQNKKASERIPLLIRNLKSGWPLLQVSLFTPTNTNLFTHALGGEKCHFFFVGAFNFGVLLTKIPGLIKFNGEEVPKKDVYKEINIGRVSSFLDSFKIEHASLNISVSSTTGTYGKSIKITAPFKKKQLLESALSKPLEFALKPKEKLYAIGTYTDHEYTKEDIEEKLDPDVAIFYEGQVFIDLGCFLEQTVNQEIKDFFHNAFKVDKFLALHVPSVEMKSSGCIIV